MKCRKCGELAGNFAQKCPVCGASLSKNVNELTTSSPKTVVNPRHSHQENCSFDGHTGDPARPLDFLTAIRQVFSRALDFRGRSRRSEFWWFYLLNSGMGFVIGFMGAIFGIHSNGLLSLWFLAILVPRAALYIRRLHDVGRSGWCCLLIFIPFGALVLFYWACKDSDPNPNRWGRSPKY